ncbi:hypothetical protein OWM54_42070 [Myxococcus sp. MISCRS1]|uniref:hypothetical protein n=1 Tax=Myxococcus sp. MISCRS1 TaxID=2996786 RepID=UPI00226ECC39|nr:hypothetical protein [Myxococcus sp. MISCRS1]MCY1003752.1 hypothetical protein [Myxococcus sp. MISCRS1]
MEQTLPPPLHCTSETFGYTAYYSDSSMTVEVGRQDCICGELYMHGSRSMYFRTHTYSSCRG